MSENKKIQSDLSQVAVNLGFYLDRLPEGDYVLILHKQKKGWQVSVLRTQEAQMLHLLHAHNKGEPT